MDGTDMKRILYKDIYWPNALVVDYITKRIFFADAKDGLISSTTFGNLQFWQCFNVLIDKYFLSKENL